jgi:hypothetical protein
MIVTGIANPPNLLHEKTNLPSLELIFLASQALRKYEVTHLITSLSPGWEQALAEAANEVEIPYTVALPYSGRDQAWKGEARIRYYDLLTRAYEVYQVSDIYSENAMLECHYWMVERVDLILTLWSFEFSGETFMVIDYGIKKGIKVTNLWRDWEALYTLKRNNRVKTGSTRRGGAQVFETKSSQRV